MGSTGHLRAIAVLQEREPWDCCALWACPHMCSQNPAGAGGHVELGCWVNKWEGRYGCMERMQILTGRIPQLSTPVPTHLLLLVKERGRGSQRKDNDRELGLGEANS